MAGYVNSWILPYTGEGPTVCSTPQDSGILSDCALWVAVGVVILMLSFEKKRKVPKS